MIRETDRYYLGKEEPAKSCLLALRSIILERNDALSESMKYGMPCFIFKGKVFCYLWTDKKTDEPYILMVDGQHLLHPKLEKGNRKRMKIFRVNPREDLAMDSIYALLDEALELRELSA
jgi:hypothetical protein